MFRFLCRKQRAVLRAILVIITLFCVGCASAQEDGGTHASEAEAQKEAAQPKEKEASSEAADGQIASEEEMAKPVEIDLQGLAPVSGSDIWDGTYSIRVDSSSSMFRITDCVLTVKDGKMTALMTMGGTGYLKLYMGTGEEAVKAAEESYIPFEETKTGEHTFEVPVDALNQETACAAFSKNKEKWYDRTLVFCADTLPPEALKEGVISTAESLGLEDGSYTVEVVLEGGSGRAGVESPASLKVENGQARVRIVWSSSNYDYMKLDDVKYDMLEGEGNSTFEIPVRAFDWKLAVIADTTAMSEPHEIAYTLFFDSASIQRAEQ